MMFYGSISDAFFERGGGRGKQNIKNTDPALRYLKRKAFIIHYFSRSYGKRSRVAEVRWAGTGTH